MAVEEQEPGLEPGLVQPAAQDLATKRKKLAPASCWMLGRRLVWWSQEEDWEVERETDPLAKGDLMFLVRLVAVGTSCRSPRWGHP